ncbi:MAG: J domain-containing protein, partial [Chloroflexi bacterium]|nr:J domain-containing protein [Chloroflexota bacterium]
MTRRDPHGVLGVEPGASPTMIKAAWRRLARTHHPDLTGDDPEASRLATQRMAEINDAYAALTRDGGRLGKRWAGAAGGSDNDAAPADPSGTRRGGPPRPKPTRPVTG